MIGNQIKGEGVVLHLHPTNAGRERAEITSTAGLLRARFSAVTKRESALQAPRPRPFARHSRSRRQPRSPEGRAQGESCHRLVEVGGHLIASLP